MTVDPAPRPPGHRAPRPAARRRELVGLALVLAGFSAVAGLAAVTLPWSGTVDAYQHLDYVYQLTQGRLPAPTGHSWEPPGYVGAILEGRQFASAHPPAWYLLLAGVIGPLLDDHWHVAVALGRVVGILVGGVGVVALWWTGLQLGGRRRTAAALALPAVGAATFCYLRFSAEVYNDLLLTAVTLTAFALLVRVLLHGPSARATVGLALLCALGAATKATFVITLVLVAVGLVLAAVLHRGGRSPARSVVVGAAHAAAVVATTVVAIGWFYVRNGEQSGAWYRSTPKSPVGDRTPRSTLDNLLNPDFWLVVPQGLVGKGRPEFTETAVLVSLTVFTLGALLTLVVVGRALVPRLVRGDASVLRSRRLWSPTTDRTPEQRRRAGVFLAGVLLTAQLGGSYAAQLSHATGYGAYNARYLLPATGAIAAVLVIGALGLPRVARAVVVVGGMLVLWTANLASFTVYASRPAPMPTGVGGYVRAAVAATEANGLPGVLVPLLLVVAALGAVGLVIVLARSEDAPRALA